MDENGHLVQTVRARADFAYMDPEGRMVVEDVKSRGTRIMGYLIKQKMMKGKLGITITEV